MRTLISLTVAAGLLWPAAIFAQSSQIKDLSTVSAPVQSGDYFVLQRGASRATKVAFSTIESSLDLVNATAACSDGQVLSVTGGGVGCLTLSTYVGGATGSTDNALLRADGTGGATVQASSWTLDDSGNATLPSNSWIGLGGSSPRISFVSSGSLVTVADALLQVASDPSFKAWAGIADTCLSIDSDRFYGDKNCDGTKDAGEEYLDDTAPAGSAGGDLTGTYPNPTVAADAVTLGTDTTGGYAASTTEGGGATSLEAGAVDATTEIAGALCGTSEILEDQGASWACIPTPSGAGTDAIGTDELDDDANTPTAGDLVTVEAGAASFTYTTPNAGTDVTADLEEETHASEHEDGGGDEIAVEDLASACTWAQGIYPDGSGGIGCTDPQIIWDGTYNTDITYIYVSDLGSVIGMGFSSDASDGFDDVVQVRSDGEIETAAGLQIGSLTDASATCIVADSDRPYADKDCDGTKDAGEEYLDQAGSSVTVSSQTCTDEGSGSPGSLTVDPTGHSYVEVTINDSNGCTLALSETGAVHGQWLQILILQGTANSASFTDTSGVLELASTFSSATINYDSLTVRYISDRWVEVGRSVVP